MKFTNHLFTVIILSFIVAIMLFFLYYIKGYVGTLIYPPPIEWVSPSGTLHPPTSLIAYLVTDYSSFLLH